MPRTTLCAGCCCQQHRHNPFHRVERWTGSYFEPSWLHLTGLVIHLGHEDGSRCSHENTSTETKRFETADNEDSDFDDFDFDFDSFDEEDFHEDDLDCSSMSEVSLEPDEPDMPPRNQSAERAVPNTFKYLRPGGKNSDGSKWTILVDSNGIHHLRVRYCNCPDAPPHDEQLLLHGLYPSSTKQPRMAFTFRVLDEYLLTNLECKTAPKSFCARLRRLTCRICPESVPVGNH